VPYRTTFPELRVRWEGAHPALQLAAFHSLPEREQADCWDELAELVRLNIESELAVEAQRHEPWCPECHDRLTEHEPGDCPKYKIPENGSPTRSSWGSGRVGSEHTDVLKTVPASVYVGAFVGTAVPANGRILCPLHDDAPTPAFKCYGTLWTCFAGCGRGEDIYKLASALTGIEAKGASFLELRRWIARALLEAGVHV
jgi:hypothetical protein